MGKRVNSARALVAVLVALCGSVLPAPGQQPVSGADKSSGSGSDAAPKPKSQLEEWLERALANHPDIKVADAKLRTAAAELERTRSLVTQQVLSLHHGIEAQKLLVQKVRIEVDRVAELVQKAVVSRAELDKARAELIAAEAKLAELQGQADHLLGKARTSTRQKALNDAMRAYDEVLQAQIDREILATWLKAGHPVVRCPMVERIRKALDRKVNFRCDDGTVEGVVAKLQKENPDLVIQMKGNVGRLVAGRADLQEVPVAAVLQWLEDSLQGCRVVVREYGVLLAPEKDVPSGAVPLVEFWKGSTEKDSGKKSPKGSS